MRGLTSLRSWRDHEGWVILALCFFTYHAASSIYAARGLTPSSTFHFFSYILLYYGFYCWITWDRQASKISFTFDYGLYFYLLLPLFIIAYLVRSRGPARAALTLLAMLGIYLATSIIAIPIYLLTLRHKP